MTLDCGSIEDRRRVTRVSRRSRHALGPHSRAIDRGAVGGSIDGRSREGRFLRVYEARLIEHVGGSPSIVQKALISRASRLALHLELLDERVFAEHKGLTQHDYQHYCAWSNSLARTLRTLGIEAPSTAADEMPSVRSRRRSHYSIDDILAARERA